MEFAQMIQGNYLPVVIVKQGYIKFMDKSSANNVFSDVELVLQIPLKHA